MTKYFIAQFVLAYQPRGAAWVSDAWADLFSGIVILIVSLAGVALYGLGLLNEMSQQQSFVTVPASADGRSYTTIPVSPEGIAVEQRSARP